MRTAKLWFNDLICVELTEEMPLQLMSCCHKKKKIEMQKFADTGREMMNKSPRLRCMPHRTPKLTDDKKSNADVSVRYKYAKSPNMRMNRTGQSMSHLQSIDLDAKAKKKGMVHYIMELSHARLPAAEHSYRQSVFQHIMVNDLQSKLYENQNDVFFCRRSGFETNIAIDMERFPTENRFIFNGTCVS